MAYKLSLDYTLAKSFLKAMDNLISSDGNAIKLQIIRLQQIDVPSNCKGSYADATVEKLTQLNGEWQTLMLQLKDCERSIAKKVEQLHAYDLAQQAKEEKHIYQPISNIRVDQFFSSIASGKSYAELEKMYTSRTKVEIADAGNKYYVKTSDGKSRYFNKSGGCTYFAAARFEKVNGKGTLIMKPGGSANGGNWHNAVDPDHFNVSETKNNYGVIRPNTLARTSSNGYGKSSNGGHVVYIEGVAEGPNGKTYVYFSQGSTYKNYEVDKMEISEFARIYSHVMSLK